MQQKEYEKGFASFAESANLGNIFAQFKLGQCYNNDMRDEGDINNYAKLMPKTVKGGVVLVDRDFHIKF